jgi:hypothetical protein
MTDAADGGRDSEGPTVRRTTVSALDVLQRQQRELLFAGSTGRRLSFRPLREGFRSRQGIINWYQAAVVRTFGHLTGGWEPYQIEQDAALLSYLTGDTSDARYTRHQLLEQVALPACQRAYQHLRTQANERVDEDDDYDTSYNGIDPDTERHVAMRPAFSRLDATQCDALADLWGGFDSRSSLVEWLHSLRPTGEFDPDLPRQVANDPAAMDYLVDNTSRDAQQYRERVAIGILLPGFARRARELQGGELPRKEADPDFWNEGHPTDGDTNE